MEYTDQEKARRVKLERLEELGVDPYGHAFKTTESAKSIKNKYSGKSKEELEI